MPRRTYLVIFALVGLLVVAGGWLVATRGGATSPIGPGVSSVSSSAEDVQSSSESTGAASATPGLGAVEFGSAVNDLAHPFSLPSATGPEFSLESNRGERSTVVVFYRAFW